MLFWEPLTLLESVFSGDTVPRSFELSLDSLCQQIIKNVLILNIRPINASLFKQIFENMLKLLIFFNFGPIQL